MKYLTIKIHKALKRKKKKKKMKNDIDYILQNLKRIYKLLKFFNDMTHTYKSKTSFRTS